MDRNVRLTYILMLLDFDISKIEVFQEDNDIVILWTYRMVKFPLSRHDRVRLRSLDG